jgi:hypothetical protein
MESKGLKENKLSECGGTSLIKYTFVKHTDPLFFIYIVIVSVVRLKRIMFQQLP